MVTKVNSFYRDTCQQCDGHGTILMCARCGTQIYRFENGEAYCDNCEKWRIYP